MKVLSLLFLLSLLACGDRDLSGNPAISDVDQFEDELSFFSFNLNANGYKGFLFAGTETLRVNINFLSNRISLNDESVGKINCTGSDCTIEWFAEDSTSLSYAEAINKIKNGYSITTKIEAVDFYVNEMGAGLPEDQVCDATFGDLLSGEKRVVSLISNEDAVEIAAVGIFVLGDPNNAGRIPSLVEGAVNNSYSYTMDLDAYFVDTPFVYEGALYLTADTEPEPYYVITATSFDESKTVNVCFND